MKTFPWFGFRERAAQRELESDLKRLWLNGERTEERMHEKDPELAAECVACGHPEEPRPAAGGGLLWGVSLCQGCAHKLAARALRKIVKRFVREQIE